MYVTYVDSNHVERGECDSLYKARRPGGRVACTDQEGKGGECAGSTSRLACAAAAATSGQLLKRLRGCHAQVDNSWGGSRLA